MIIYETVNKINGKRYIGKDSNNDPNYLGSGIIFLRALKKYGSENFVKTILSECENIEELDNMERFWITVTNAQKSKNYYNVGPGGDGGDTITHHPQRDAFIEKMTKINKGENNGMYGKHHSQEAKQLQKKAAAGRYTLEWFIGIYGEDEGKIKYKERSQNISDSHKGPNNPAYKFVDKGELSHLIKTTEMNFKELCKYFDVGTTCMYGKFKIYYNCKNLKEVKVIV